MSECEKTWKEIMKKYGPDMDIALILYLEKSIQDKRLLKLIEYWRKQ